MNRIKFFPGDVAIINGAEITMDHTVTLSSQVPIERIPTPGLTDLPDSSMRVEGIWKDRGHRPRMVFRHDLRCPCGSAYLRQSETHISCQRCRRVWENDELGEGSEDGIAQATSEAE